MVDNQNLKCLLCEENCREAKRSLVILGCHICRDCEEKIVRARAGESDYALYMSKLKKIWEVAIVQ